MRISKVLGADKDMEVANVAHNHTVFNWPKITADKDSHGR